MVEAINLNYTILNEYIEEKCGGKEYFLGCWSPDPLCLESEEVPDNLQLSTGKNWFVVRNGADQTDGLVFPKVNDTDPEVVVFKGYLLNETIHSYSPGEQVRSYWSENLTQRHNGIFSAVTISNDGKELSLITDIFGMGSMYYRRVGDLVFFSSAHGLLAMHDDEPDKMSWIMRIILGYAPGKDTLTEDIKMPVPASITSFDQTPARYKKWYDHKNFPQGINLFDDQAIERSERSLSQAMERCNQIKYGKNILPLSSGHDSRRLLAHLMDKNVDFEASTAQMPESTGEDVDAVFAAKIAKDFNLNHEIIEMSLMEKWYEDEKQRIYSLDSHSAAHTWSVAYFNHYNGTKGCFYDGLGGDNLAVPPWEFDVATIDEVPGELPWWLNQSIFPPLEHVLWNFNNMYMPPTYGINAAIITALMWGTRNNTSLWAQQQTRPGQLVICPYLELDYLELMFSYVVDEYEVRVPQAMTLEKCWPELAKYPCSRDFEEDLMNKKTPDDILSIAEDRKKSKLYAYKKIYEESMSAKNVDFHYDKFLTKSARWTIYFSKFNPFLKKKIKWWVETVSELMLWWQTRPFVIEIKKED